MQLKTIESLIQNFIENEAFELYQVRETTIFGSHGIEVLIDNEEAPISTEDIEKVHHYLLSLPDDVLPDSYVIEVSSVGVERPLLKYDDYVKAKHKYVFIKSDYYKGYGYIEDISSDNVTLKYEEKTKVKTINIPLKAISEARRAVKI